MHPELIIQEIFPKEFCKPDKQRSALARVHLYYMKVQGKIFPVYYLQGIINYISHGNTKINFQYVILNDTFRYFS